MAGSEVTITVRAIDQASRILRQTAGETGALHERATALFKETQGGQRITAQTAAEIRGLARDLRLQDQAQRSLARTWLAGRGQLQLVGDAFRRVAAAGRTAANVLSQLSIIQTANVTAAKNLKDTQMDVAAAQEKTTYWTLELQKAQEEGDTEKMREAYRSQQTAVAELEQAQRRLRDAQYEVTEAQTRNQIHAAALGLSLLDLVPSVTLTAASLTALKTAGMLGASVLWGAVAAAGALAAGFGLAAANVVIHRGAVESWGEAVEAARRGTEGFPPVLKELADVLTISAGGWILLGERVAVFTSESWGGLSKWWSDTEKGFETWRGVVGGTLSNWAGDAWNTIVGWGESTYGFITGVWTSIADSLSSIWQGIVDTAGRIWGGLVATVRGVFSAVARMINVVIDAFNGLRFEVPDWVPMFGGQTWGFNLPRIPEFQGLTEPVTFTRETLAVLHEGERLLPQGWSGGGVTVHMTNNFAVPDEATARRVSEIIAERLRRLTRG